MQWPVTTSGSWDSGLPFLDEALKQGKHPERAGLQLLLGRVDVSALQVSFHSHLHSTAVSTSCVKFGGGASSNRVLLDVLI